MRFYTLILSFFLCSSAVTAQELFPLAEPASSIPKGVLGFRSVAQFYEEKTVTREMLAEKIMYGLTSKLSIEVTATGSNHHDTILPNNLLTHTHASNGAPISSATTPTRGIPYPFLFAGFNFYAKYRILSFDGQKSHFRMALFGDYSTVRTAHDEAEPGLMNDDGGWEAGLIATKLIDRWAVSLTTGFIQPIFSFYEVQSQYVNPPQTTQIWYGKALEYNLSIGYRFFPKKYTNDYSEANFNAYIEFIGKSYDSATVKYDGAIAPIKTSLLQRGTYIEMHPGIQWIVNSNSRFEISVGYPILNESYVHFYPVYTVAFQRYFYFVKKQSPKPE